MNFTNKSLKLLFFMCCLHEVCILSLIAHEWIKHLGVCVYFKDSKQMQLRNRNQIWERENPFLPLDFCWPFPKQFIINSKYHKSQAL